jgi:IMP dehydrogenase
MGNPLKEIEESLTFDDVLLIPVFSEVLPKEVDISTQLTRTIRLNIPLVSAAMDTPESRTAICSPRRRIGIIHRNMPISDRLKDRENLKAE